jgi:hypothetical protein
MGASTRAAVTSVGAAAVALAGFAADGLLAGVVLALSMVFAAGWSRLVDLPTHRGAVVVVAGVAVAALAVTLTSTVAVLGIVMGLAVVAAFVHQMLRRDGRPRLTESVSGVVSGAVVVVSAAGWVAVGTSGSSPALVVTGAATIAAAAAVTTVPVTARTVVLLAPAAGGLAGLLAGVLLLDDVGPVPGLLVGLAAGVLTSALHVLFGRFPASRRLRPALAAALLPVLVVGVPVYLVSRLLAA